MAQSFARFVEAGTAQQDPVRVARWFWRGLGFFVLTGAALIIGRFPVEIGEGPPVAPSLRLLAPLLWMIGCAIAASPMVLAFMYAWNAMRRTMPALAERAVLRVGSLAAGAVLLPIPFWIVAVMVVDGVAPADAVRQVFVPAVSDVPSMWRASLLPAVSWIVLPQVLFMRRTRLGSSSSRR